MLKLCYAHLASNHMPKKTKKEKLIAQYRRKLQQLEGTPIQPTIHTNAEPILPTISDYVLPKDVLKREVTPTTLALDKNEFLAIQKDLVKTLIIICFFFGIEFALWRLFI